MVLLPADGKDNDAVDDSDVRSKTGLAPDVKAGVCAWTWVGMGGRAGGRSCTSIIALPRMLATVLLELEAIMANVSPTLLLA